VRALQHGAFDAGLLLNDDHQHDHFDDHYDALGKVAEG
jgi:hypothetical protein